MCRRRSIIRFTGLLGLLGSVGCSHLCSHPCPPPCPAASAYRPCDSCAPASSHFLGVPPNPVSLAPPAPGAGSVAPGFTPPSSRGFASNYPSTPPPPLARKD